MHGKKSGAGIGHDEPAVRGHTHLKQPPGHLLRQAPKAALLLHAQPIAALALQRKPDHHQRPQDDAGRAHSVALHAAGDDLLGRSERRTALQPGAHNGGIPLDPAPGIQPVCPIHCGHHLVGPLLEAGHEELHPFGRKGLAQHRILRLRARQIGTILTHQQYHIVGAIEQRAEVAPYVIRGNGQHQNADEPTVAVQPPAELDGPLLRHAPAHGPANEQALHLLARMDLEMLAVTDRNPRQRLAVALQAGKHHLALGIGHGDLHQRALGISVQRRLHRALKIAAAPIGVLARQLARCVVEPGKQRLHLHRDGLGHLPHTQPSLLRGVAALGLVAVQQNDPVPRQRQPDAQHAQHHCDGCLGPASKQ